MTRTNTRLIYHTDRVPWGQAPKPHPGDFIPMAPKFIRNLHPVQYNHLPRPAYSAFDEGTLPDRIGWVVTHPDLIAQVKVRVSHMKRAKTQIEIYRYLTKAVTTQKATEIYIKRSSAPKCEKEKALDIARETHNSLVDAATKVMDKMATPGMARALSDLLPGRTQHFNTHPTLQTTSTSSRGWGTPFSPMLWDDIPKEEEQHVSDAMEAEESKTDPNNRYAILTDLATSSGSNSPAPSSDCRD